jgi:hypothetical protein
MFPSMRLYSKDRPMVEEDYSTDQIATPPSIEQLIERWWADHFPGSAVARDTQAWNIAHAAKERLKRLLKGSK